MTGREAIEKTLEILGYDPFDEDNQPKFDMWTNYDGPTFWDELPDDVFMAVTDLMIERRLNRKTETLESITSIWDLLDE